MAKPRVTATDHLQNVIEVVELGRRTGLLSVERGSGPVLEEGEIYFLNGRVIYAAVASLRGREAMMVLARWGECRFAFDPDAPRPTPNVSGVLPSLDMIDPSRSWPSPAPPAPSGPFTAPSGPLAPLASPFPPSPDASGARRSPPASGSSLPGGVPDPRRVPPPPFSPPPAAPLGAGPRDPSFSGGYHPNPLLARRPRRAPDVRDLMAIVTAYNLSRAHRTILLLADGEHTVLDLARLSSKSVDEVLQLLNELEGFGLIYYYQ